MSTERIFGGWDTHPDGVIDELVPLWHILAAQNTGTADFVPNLGLSQRRNEIVPLWELYRRARPKIVLEVGVAQGGTFASWCILGRDDATMIAMDRDLNDCRPRQGEPVHPMIYQGDLRMSHEGGGVYCLRQRRQRVVGINGWSHDQNTLVQLTEQLAGEKIDWLFHDASHSAEMFAKDFSIYWPMIADGGVFSAHDINISSDPNCNKSVEWERIKSEEKYSAVYEFLPHTSVTEMGIGVLIK